MPTPLLTPLERWIAAKLGLPGDRVDPTRLRAYQLDRLNQTLVWVRTRSRFYQQHLVAAPERLSDLRQLSGLPFTTAEHLRADPPGFLCVRPDDVSRIVTLPTSGTTGPPKRLYFTAEDQELTRDFFCHGMSTLVGPGDRVGILLPGTIPGSVGDLLREGLARLDVTGLVLGPVRDPEETLRALAEFQADSLVGIPVQVLELARLSRFHPQWPLRLKNLLLSTDYVPQAVVRVLEDTWSCAVFNHYGSTEMGLGGGVDCAVRGGYHLREADLLFEVVDPETGAVLPEGERGEVVFTTLTRTAMPLVRYRTGDLSSFLLETCPCGTTLRRLAHVEGRVGAAAPVGAGTISQRDLDECLLSLPGVIDFRATVETVSGEAPERGEIAEKRKTVDYLGSGPGTGATAGVGAHSRGARPAGARSGGADLGEDGSGGARLQVAVRYCADCTPLEATEVETALRRSIAALSCDAHPPVALQVRLWDEDAGRGTGTSKRKITTTWSSEAHGSGDGT